MTSRELNRVVVTGLGAITPIGNNLEEYWQGLIQAKNGIGYITHFDTTDYACKIAGEVKDFDPLDYITRKEAKRMGRFSQFALAASKDALKDANLKINDDNADDIGVLIGTGIGGLSIMEEQNEVLLTKGPSRVSPFTVPSMISNMAAGLPAIHTGANGRDAWSVRRGRGGGGGGGR